MMKRLAAIAMVVACGASSATAETSGEDLFTGLYFGMFGGGGWGLASWDTPNGVAIWTPSAGFPATGLTIGVFGGIHAGYSYDFGPVVLGVEGSLSLSNVDGQVQCGDGAVYGYVCNTDLAAFGTLTGRIGHAFGPTQFYVNGGLAWGRHRLEITEPYFAYVYNAPTAHSWGAATEDAFGWAVGFGVERYLSHGFSVRADYAYAHFPTRDATLTSPFWPDTLAMVSQGYHFASIGLNYRLGTDDATTPYRPTGEGAWDVSVGLRSWLNLPYYRFDLYDPFAPTSQISRLTYSGAVGLAGEAFVNAEGPSGLFVNARLGTGVAWSGTLVDEDFPPYIVPYTATVSDLIGSRLSYGGVDIGWEIVGRERLSIGVFAGLNTMLERYQSFGCLQTQAGSPICVPSVPGDYEVISQTALWGGIRFGVTGEIELTDRLAWSADAAVEPLMFLAAIDNHWLRPDINPLTELGQGFGVQLETALSYDVTSNLSLGVGGRFWWRQANGVAIFPGLAEPQTTTSRNFGVFLEASYTIGD